MKEMQKVKSKKLLAILPIFFALVLFVNVDSVQAQNWDYITLFQGQSATVSASQATPIGSHFVWVTTIGNVSLGAGINGIRGATSGFWLITVLGTGTTKRVDVAGGFIPWNSGQRAIIDLQRNTNVNFGLIVSTLIVTAADSSVGYNIAVSQ